MEPVVSENQKKEDRVAAFEADPTFAQEYLGAPASALAHDICSRRGPKLPGSSWRPRYEVSRLLTFKGTKGASGQAIHQRPL